MYEMDIESRTYRTWTDVGNADGKKAEQGGAVHDRAVHPNGADCQGRTRNSPTEAKGSFVARN